MLISHTLKRSAGIGPVESGLENRIEDLADAFMVILTATGFLEYENEAFEQQPRQGSALFH
jgi:nuclear pore complex protein Nup205